MTTEQLNYAPDLGTLARHALYRELLATVSEDEVEALVGRLEIRVRKAEPNWVQPFGRFQVQERSSASASDS
ncbi:hypothetical protein SAMN05444172_1589 [Burkholderia sp. GAS332]|nr:hypothetical protein SAMN05444172_1589 [Burkholderia sp. GAS332]